LSVATRQGAAEHLVTRRDTRSARRWTRSLAQLGDALSDRHPCAKRVIVREVLAVGAASAGGLGSATGALVRAGLPCPIELRATLLELRQAPLLVLRGAAVFNDQAMSPSQRLWLWDGAHARWLLDQSLTPEDALAYRLSWTDGQATLWVISAELVTPPTIDLFTATFAQPPIAQPQRVAGG